MLSSCQEFLILIWSPKLKFKIWGRSDQWLQLYSTFNILRSSSNGGCLHFKSLQFWLGPLSISLKSEEDPMSGCWEMDVTSLYDGTGGWPGYYLENNATLWPYLASWDLSDFQLSWDFKIGPSVAILLLSSILPEFWGLYSPWLV